MNNAEKLIIQMEVQEYLKEQSKVVVGDIKKAFPEIKNVKVVINIWFGPFKKEESRN